MSELFKFAHTKTSYESGHASVDISVWLRTETIQSVVFSAKNLSTKQPDTSVINTGKSTYGGIYVKPYIQNGVSGQSYRVRMQVFTAEDSSGDFFIDFEVKDF